MRARKRVQGSRDVAETDAHLQGHGGRAGGVLDVVPAGLAKVYVADQLRPAIDGKRALWLAAVGRAVPEPVRYLAGSGVQLARELVVRAQDRQPTLGQAFDEPLEQVPHRAQVAEVVGMV